MIAANNSHFSAHASSTKMRMMQRRFVWPWGKEDTQMNEAVHILYRANSSVLSAPQYEYFVLIASIFCDPREIVSSTGGWNFFLRLSYI